LLVLVFPAATVSADGIKSLRRFYSQVKTFSASFSQVVLDESLSPIQETSGKLLIKRPGSFRWDYLEPFKQHIVSDGKKIWVYDVELKQATFRAVDAGLGQTPAFLLSGSGRIDDNFELKSLGKQGKLEWTQMKPKKSDGGYENIRIAFENGQLRMLEMVDSFGQTTRVTLADNRENGKIDNSRFQFSPPAGVDIVGAPVQ